MMPDEQRFVTYALFFWVVGGLAAFQTGAIYVTNLFHTEQRVRVWNALREYDQQRQLVSVQLATLQGRVDEIAANTTVIRDLLNERNKP
jgi:hypothetical protein